MTRIEEARNTMNQFTALATILSEFYWDGELGHVMYFTEDEVLILAEYLINNGIVVPTEKENRK
jgi:hypothetical protein